MCREYSDRDYVVRLSVDLAGLAAAGLVVPKAYGPMAPRFQTLRVDQFAICPSKGFIGGMPL